MSEAGPNGLSDREWIPSCGTGRLSSDELTALRESLVAHHICEQKVTHQMYDASPYRVVVNLPGATCEVHLDHSDSDRTPDGRASYDTIVRATLRVLPANSR